MSRRVNFSVCLMYRKWRWHLMVDLITSWIIWELELVTVNSTQDQKRGFVPIVHQRLQNISQFSDMVLFCLYLQTSTAAFKSFLESRAKICSSSSGIISTAIIAWPILVQNFYSPWKKNNGLDYDLFSCIKDFRSRGRKSGLLTKHGIADKSLAWHLALRDADDIRSRLVISQNAEE